MKLILVLLSFLCLIPNLDSPQELTNIGGLRIILDWVITLILAYGLLNYLLREYSEKFRDQVACSWLMFLVVSELVLAYCWTPYLSQSNPHWGFDPQRYYSYMSYFIKYGHFGEFGLNYKGVLFFYLPFLMVMGLSPIVPLFVNSILLLLSSLFVIKMIQKEISGYCIVALVLFPELIWFGVMSSREIPCAFALIISIYAYVNYTLIKSRKFLFLTFFGLAFMGVVRLPFMFALFMVICIHAALYSKQKWLMLAGVVSFMFIGTYLSSVVGSDTNQAELVSSLSYKVTGSNGIMRDGSYSDNSIARLLIPHSPIQFVIYGILRSFLYLFPSISIFKFALPNSYSVGDAYLVGYSSLFMFLTIPFVFNSIKNTFSNNGLIFKQVTLIAFLTFWLFVGCCNTSMIHIRYRVVYDLLYVLLVIMYLLETPKNEILSVFYKWCLSSVFIILMFFVYKTI